MKNNQPVTEKETVIPEGETLVSKTDKKGTIQSANDIFIKISGFSQDELYGQSHNVVRHPDVPPRVFEDLWETLKAGKPWSQVVKNRCKDGSHYWVHANACPILENNQVVGYTSYRTPVVDEAIKKATQAAYRGIANGSLSIEQGQVYTSFQHTIKRVRICTQTAFGAEEWSGGAAFVPVDAVCWAGIAWLGIAFECCAWCLFSWSAGYGVIHTVPDGSSGRHQSDYA